MDFSQYFHWNARLLLETLKNLFLLHFSSTSHYRPSVLIHQDMTSRNISLLTGTVYIPGVARPQFVSRSPEIQSDFQYNFISSFLVCRIIIIVSSLFVCCVVICVFFVYRVVCVLFIVCRVFIFVSSQKGRNFRDYLSIH